ncbi:hypothetical protein [Actinopolymorpha pittospori]|uniref:Uncharacterized protein n=1 Tax=Actinopolymorpha pittospori TaxID=648752 RepID=A0A927RBB2_9ACTN|nr:hypothetical protein [Actinopolymorpha pittospori]MBE1608584.1 hypothetical protein [Actinopolymorpha pittospori]
MTESITIPDVNYAAEARPLLAAAAIRLANADDQHTLGRPAR